MPVTACRRSEGDPPQPQLQSGTAPRLTFRVLALAALFVPQALVLLVQGAAPLLLREAPFVLLALHPYEPWSLLVSARTDIVPFVVVVVSVRSVLCWGDYLVGRWYGPRTLHWLSRRQGSGRLTAAVLRFSARAGGALLLLYPGATASVLAGVHGMPVRRFLPLMMTGIVLGALLTRVLAAAASGPVRALAAFSDRYAVVVGLVLFLLLLFAAVLPRRTPSGPDGGEASP